MKENRKEKRKRRLKRRMILGIGIVVICLLLFQCLGPGKKSLSEYETEVNEITEIDYSKQQERLNEIVEEGKMNVNYSAEAVFSGKKSEKFNIKNIKNNHHPIKFSLFDEKGECLYESKKIEPGYEMTKIELEKQLSKGIHACKLKVGYDAEGNVSSVFPITIEVK